LPYWARRGKNLLCDRLLLNLQPLLRLPKLRRPKSQPPKNLRADDRWAVGT
jgi:hypothetical protein